MGAANLEPRYVFDSHDMSDSLSSAQWHSKATSPHSVAAAVGRAVAATSAVRRPARRCRPVALAWVVSSGGTYPENTY